MFARFTSIVVGLLAVADFRIGFAWGPEGHGLVAAIAEANLEQQSKAEASGLMKKVNGPYTGGRTPS